MKKELLFDGDMNGKQYLSHLLSIYPYDIEEEMVFSLLSNTTYPHPVLLNFIRYFSSVTKLHIYQQQNDVPASLKALFMKMSALAQKDDGVRMQHHFDFMADILLCEHTFSHPYAHLPFHKILFIEQIHLHHIPLITMKKEQPVTIVQTNHFIYRDISIDASHYVAISIEITQKHGIIFLSRECLSLAIALRAMFHSDAPSTHQDFILIFGFKDTLNRMEYYYDATNELYIGLVRGDESMHNFLYLKQMIITLYNAMRIHQNDLPLHASMLQIQIQEKTLGLLFMGNRGAGKSELLKACMDVCRNRHITCKPYFDDHGTLHYLDNEIVATANELSACTKLHPYDLSSTFQFFNDAVFLKEEDGDIYQITPLIPYEDSCSFHHVDYIFHLDEHKCDDSIRLVKTIDECMQIMKQTDQSLSQKEAMLLQEFITQFYMHNINVYTLCTHAGIHQKQNRCLRLANQLLQIIMYENNC